MRTFAPIFTGCLLSLCACGSSAGDSIHIGGLFSTTGPNAQKGFAQLSAARLAVQQINEAGGVLGQRLVLVYRDDGEDLNKGRRAVDALLDHGVPAIVGATSSEITGLAAGVAQGKALLVSPSATQTSLATSDFTTIRLCDSDLVEGRLLGQLGRDKGRRAAMLHHGDAAPGSLASGFAESFPGDALHSLVADRTLEHGQESFRQELTQLLAARPDVVLLDVDPIDGAQVIRDFLTSHSASSVTWLFSHQLEDDGFITAVGAQAFGFSHLGVGPSLPTGRRYTLFAEAYKARFGAAPPIGSYAANAYDAVFLIAGAMVAAGGTEPTALRARLPQVSLGGRAFGPDEWPQLVQALRAGEDVNYEGASGSVDVNAEGGTSAPYDVWSVKDGAITIDQRAVRPRQ